jgi:predicted ATPase
MIGTVLNDRYRLDAEIGRGGMGKVYRAHDTLLSRDVAVKVLSAAALGTQGQARLLTEAQAAAQLNHPNVVSVYDAGEAALLGREELVSFVVMELVEGPSLFERPPQALDQVLALARQVCAALEHAHSHGIVHRDLKPENVLLTRDQTAKLSDFGLARSVASRLTTDGTIVGSVFYLAPELALGQPFDGRADLYALGVMLYELTTGRVPFEADDPLAVISQHLHAPVAPPRARNPEVPPGLDALIVRLLSKAPEDRPASAVEVGEALARLAAGEAVPGEPDACAVELSMLDRIVRGRMVARERELAQARALWQQARAGEGQMLLVSGEPGIGKTRLVRELVTQVQVVGDTALVGECYAEGGAPYAPFAQILRRTFQNGACEELALPDFVLADLLKLAPALRLCFPDVPPNPPLDPESEQQRLFENMVAFCGALSERRPLLLALEDAHWADSGSLALLRHLARRTRRQRVLLVATYREVELDETLPFQEVLVDLTRERLVARLKLSRLSQDGTRDLLAVLFAEEISPEFLAGIYRETEGNPFFVEEVCKALVESGQVYFVDGTWDRLAMDELAIPQSVRVAIQSRVGRLPDAVQEVLRLAAILGREFDVDTLAEAIGPSTLRLRSGQAGSGQGLDEDTLIDALEAAEGAQLIEEVSGERGVTFAFVHALFPATLAEGVRTLRRRRMHRRVAEAIERLRPDDYEALAHHYGQAGDEERALRYHTRAGERASEAYANADAERHFRAALDLVQLEADRARLAAGLGRVQARQSAYEQAIETWEEAIAIYRAAEDLEQVARLHAWSARAAWNAGDPPRGLALCREGMVAVEGAPESPGLANLLHETARACFFNGLPDDARSLGRQALEMAERLGDVRVQAECLCTLGLLPGQPIAESAASLSRAVELAESAGLLATAARAHNNLAGLLEEDAGDLSTARMHYARAAELSRQRGAVTQELFYAANAVILSSLQGALVAMEEELRALRRLMEASHDPGSAVWLVEGTEALLLRYRGELGEAIPRLSALQVQAREVGDLQVLAGLAAFLAEALIEAGREEEAEAALHEGIALVERGAPGDKARLCMFLGVVRARQGALGEARRLLSEAQAQVRGSLTGALLPWGEAQLAAAAARWDDALTAHGAAAETMARVGLRWYRAHTFPQWAEAHLARGEGEDIIRARELLREAAEEFDAMGAPLYAAQARERLQALAGEA